MSSTVQPQPHGLQDPAFFKALSSAKADGFSGDQNIGNISVISRLEFGPLSIGLEQDGGIAYWGPNPLGPARRATHAELKIVVHTLHEVVNGHRASVPSDADPRFLPGIEGTAAVILKYAREQEREHVKPVSDADKQTLASFGFDT